MESNNLDPMDHRSLGNKLKLFMFNEATPGMPFWLPNGARLKRHLENIIYESHKQRDYEPVLSPAMMEDTMWKISGHYDNYRENMFPSEVEKRNYLLKPMNCPGHVLLYKNEVRSYRDLPLRFFEFGQVHRNENAGSLHGLFRVREFTQDDAHIFCMEEQIEDEIKKVMEFVEALLHTFNFKYSVEVSTKPDKAIGSEEVWNKSENAIKSALQASDIKYKINEGDGAFYGPKIDIKITDMHKREWQLGTIQIDFNLPERFEIEYTDAKGHFQRPVMIHRAIMGSFERFIGILLEHYLGKLPIALSPNQVAIVPISSESDKQMDFAFNLKKRLKKELGADSIIFDNNDTLNKRIKNAEQMKNPIIAIIGDKEVDENILNLRHKIKQKRYEVGIEEFLLELKKDMDLKI